MAVRWMIALLTALAPYATTVPACATPKTVSENGQPPEITETRIMEFNRKAPTGAIKITIGGTDGGLLWDENHHQTISGSGFNSLSESGFAFHAKQTIEEVYFRVATWPAGYVPENITVHNRADPTDKNDVEHTPRYWIYAYPDRVMGHVWLRARGVNATRSQLKITLEIKLIRADLYQGALKDGHAAPLPASNLAYYRDVRSCEGKSNLRIEYTPLMHVDTAITDPVSSVKGIVVPCEHSSHKAPELAIRPPRV